MGDEEEGEPGGCENGEGEGRGVAVDDDGRVPCAVGIGKVWVDIAIDGRPWQLSVNHEAAYLEVDSTDYWPHWKVRS